MSYKPLVLHENNPFREQLHKRIQVKAESDSGLILNETVTIVRERQYIQGKSWVKLTQDKELLKDLSPWGWAIIGYIALNLEINQEQMKISCREVGMDKRKFSKTMLELMLKRIIANTGKREYYWINIGILLFGTVNKH